MNSRSLVLSLAICLLAFPAAALEIPLPSADGELIRLHGKAAARLRVSCESAELVVDVPANGVVDLDREAFGDCSGAVFIEDSALVDAFHVLEGSQTLLADQSCDVPRTVFAPSSACRRGVANLAVTPWPGARYQWSIEGGVLIEGSDTSRVTVVFGDEARAKVVVDIVTDSCATKAEAIVDLRAPLTLGAITSVGLRAGEPVTLTWTYESGAPAVQTLILSDVLEPIVMPQHQRSYTYTPMSGGEREIVLRASTVDTRATSGGRRRAGGRTVADASHCGTVEGKTTLKLQGCEFLPLRVSAPDDTAPNETFTARVLDDVTGTFQWEITNGTAEQPSTGSSIVIKAAATGTVRVRVTVARPGSCPYQGAATISVKQPLPCTNPTATILSVGPYTCETGMINIRYTGTPPFRVTLSNNITYTTSNHDHSIAVPHGGAWLVRSFRDATCEGTVSGTATMPQFQPAVAQSVVNAGCVVGDLVATFTGTPPFRGKWTDGVSFTSNDAVYVRRDVQPGSYRLAEASDARCSVVLGTQPYLQIQPSYGLGASFTVSCGGGAAVLLTLGINGGRPPYTVTWTDGLTATYPTATSSRTIQAATPVDIGLLKVVDAGGCVIKSGGGLSRIQGGQQAQIAYSSAKACAEGAPVTATITNTTAAANVTWTLTNATILSGQGTREITFVARDVTGNVELDMKATAPGLCMYQNRRLLPIQPLPTAPRVFGVPFEAEVNKVYTFTPSFDANTTPGPMTLEGVGTMKRLSCNGATWACSYEFTSSELGTALLRTEGTGCNGVKKSWAVTFPVGPKR